MTTHPVERTTTTLTGDMIGRDSSGNQIAHWNPYVVYQDYYRDRGGSNSPGWPHFKSTNGYHHYLARANRVLMNIQFTNSFSGVSYSGSDVHNGSDPSSDAGSGAFYPAVPTNEVSQKIVNKLLSKMSQQKVNVAQFIAEREQTKNLIVSSARRIASAVTSLRRGNVVAAVTSLTGVSRSRGIKRVAGGIPEQWLALQYGWKPLLSDIYGSCEELAAHNTGVKPDVYTVNASASTEYEGQYETGGDGDWIPPIKWKGTGRVSGKGSISASIGSPTIAGLSSFGVVNPVQLAWELLPWSFVVDWFLPVGQFIQNCSAEDGLAFSHGYISLLYDIKWNAKLTRTSYSNPISGWSGSLSGANHSAQVFGMVRSSLTAFPNASWPSFKDPFSPTHVANALSLLAAAFSGGKTVR